MTIDEINAWSTVVVAVTAVISILVNIVLVLEQRANRNVAQVDAYPMPWAVGGMYLALRLENHGPAVATDVRLTFRMKRDAETAGERHHGQAVMLVGGRSTFLPDSTSQGLQGMTVQDFADMGLTLEAEWQWKDGRRRFSVWPFGLRSAVHRGRLATPIVQLRDDFYGGWALIEPSVDLSLETIAEELATMRKLDEERDRTARRERFQDKIEAGHSEVGAAGARRRRKASSVSNESETTRREERPDGGASGVSPASE